MIGLSSDLRLLPRGLHGLHLLSQRRVSFGLKSEETISDIDEQGRDGSQRIARNRSRRGVGAWCGLWLRQLGDLIYNGCGTGEDAGHIRLRGRRGRRGSSRVTRGAMRNEIVAAMVIAHGRMPRRSDLVKHLPVLMTILSNDARHVRSPSISDPRRHGLKRRGAAVATLQQWPLAAHAEEAPHAARHRFPPSR
jgi:hypothetical protein